MKLFNYSDFLTENVLIELLMESKVVFSKKIKKQICSVLAGYVWDLENPFVKRHDRALKSLANVIRMNREKSSV